MRPGSGAKSTAGKQPHGFSEHSRQHEARTLWGIRHGQARQATARVRGTLRQHLRCIACDTTLSDTCSRSLSTMTT
eukprot:1438266-Rhodomonas_salina.2